MTYFRRQYHDAWHEAGYAVSSDGACFLAAQTDLPATPGRTALGERLLPTLQAAQPVGQLDLDDWLAPEVRPYTAKNLNLLVSPATGRLESSPEIYFSGSHTCLDCCSELSGEWYCRLRLLDGLLRAFPRSTRTLYAWLGGSVGVHAGPPAHRPLLLTLEANPNPLPGRIWAAIMPVRR
jgi:hypothetical protein